MELLDPLDILAYSSTCKRFEKYADDQKIWRHQWDKLSRKTPFSFLPTEHLVEVNINFRDACKRIWKILVNEGHDGIHLNPTKCIHCREYTCMNACIIDRQASSNKVAIDIGGKMTWIVTTNFTLKRHLSMVAVPKMLKCFDCDTTIRREDYMCDCHPKPHDQNPSVNAQFHNRAPYCQNRRMQGHTALEYCSQPLTEIWIEPNVEFQPFCIFCEEDKMKRLSCEREMVSSTKHKVKRAQLSAAFTPTSNYGANYSLHHPTPSLVSSQHQPSCCMSTTEECPDYSRYVSPLMNGYCRDTASILGVNNLDLLSPLLALEHEDAFPIVRSFLAHLLNEYNMLQDLQKPNSSLILTEPGKLPLGVKESLLKLFFEEMKISRLCLLPKAIAIARLFEVGTCIVVDSGATSTSVWVVIDGKVDETKTGTVNVGGWHVSQFLKQAVSWSDNQEAAAATISTFDTSAVKQKCRLSLNLAREGEQMFGSNSLNLNGSGNMNTANTHLNANDGYPATAETLHIRSQRDINERGRLEQMEVTLSSELYLAPEMMYASLGLPVMVKEATKDLSQHLIKDCFSNILITGGNTDLQGFAQRFSSDLRELLPEHAPIINVFPFPTGNHSWNTVMGANAIQVPIPYENVLQLNEPGDPLWMTREEYIIFGAQRLASCDSEIREG